MAGVALGGHFLLRMGRRYEVQGAVEGMKLTSGRVR